MKRLLIALLLALPAYGQVNVAPMPVPKQQFFSSTGQPLALGKLQTYACGGTTPLSTYTSSTGMVTNLNPTILDSAGRANVWLGPSCYKFVLSNSSDVVQWTVDGVKSPTGSLTIAGLVVSGDLTVDGTTTAAGVLNGSVAASTYSGADACAKIQAAHDDMPAYGGKIIADFVGTQVCGTALSITKPVNITGLGKLSTKLSYTVTSGNFIAINVDSTSIYDRSQHATLSDITIDGPNSGTGTGIAVIDGPGFVLQRVAVTEFRDGVVVNGNSSDGTITNLGIFNEVESRDNVRYGIKLSGNGTELTSFYATDASENDVGFQIESGLNQFWACSAYLNTTNDVVFSGSLSSLNRGFIYIDQAGVAKFVSDSSAGYNEIYAIGGSMNESHPILNTAGTDGSGHELNFTLRRAPVFKDPTGSSRAASFDDEVFVTAPNSGSHVGTLSLGQVLGSNTSNITGSVEGVRGTVTTVTAGTGTVTTSAGLRSTAVYNGAAVTNHYGLLIDAPTGSVTPTNSYGVIVASAGTGATAVNRVGFGANPAAVRHVYQEKTWTTPAATVTGITGYNYAKDITGANSNSVEGVHGAAVVDAANTQNWTDATGGVRGVVGEVSSITGATGTFTWASSLTATAAHGAGTWTNWAGLHVVAPTGSGTITNKYAIYVDASAGKIASASGSINPGSVALADFPASPANGDIIYCNNCLKGSTPCSASSTGAMAKRENGAWNCD